MDAKTINHFKTVRNESKRLAKVYEQKVETHIPMLKIAPETVSVEVAVVSTISDLGLSNAYKPKLFDKFVNENEIVKYNDRNIPDIFDINDVYKKGITTICNVYQLKYKDDKYVTGFGDFIRGSYFAMHFCDRFNLRFVNLLNHPVHEFFEHSNFFNENQNIPIFANNNCASHSVDKNNIIRTETALKNTSVFITYLTSECPIYKELVFIYNIGYPSHKIRDEQREYMRYCIAPNSEMIDYTNETLVELGLRKSEYRAIHVRSGDVYLNGNVSELSSEYADKLVGVIYNLVKKLGFAPYLFLSDNTIVKQMILSRFPFFKTKFCEISHLGGEATRTRESIKNTMLDFYLLSHAISINSISCYAHGSGFAEWCAETYKIPFSCQYLSVD
jgi:hypothetical protein